MSDHLPECPATNCGCGKEEECGPRCIHTCICDRLRACEQRVEAEYEEVTTATARNYLSAGYKDGYAAGLAAARDAVAALPIITIGLCDKGRAIAAIDALKEKP